MHIKEIDREKIRQDKRNNLIFLLHPGKQKGKRIANEIYEMSLFISSYGGVRSTKRWQEKSKPLLFPPA